MRGLFNVALAFYVVIWHTFIGVEKAKSGESPMRKVSNLKGIRREIPMVVELPITNKIPFIIFSVFFLFNPFLFDSVSFAQTASDCTQVKCVKIENGQLTVYSFDEGKYNPYFIKGVGYQPTPIGRHPSDWGWLDGNDPRNNNIFDDPDILNRDFSKLQLMNANTIRIWKGNDTQDAKRFPNKLTAQTMVLAAKYHLKIIAGFWVDDLTFDDQGNVNNRQDTINRFVQFVNDFKQYPAILLWAIGNENNYNKIDDKHGMDPQQLSAWYALVNDMARAAHDAEGPYFHPVAVVNGEINDIGDSSNGTTDDQMPDLDIWGANVYRGISFGSLFNEYQQKSLKPLWISEFGPDAWHVNDIHNPDNGYEDQGTQSDWTAGLWDEIAANAPVTIGGTVMEYSDEWWKPKEWRCSDPDAGADENAQLVKNCNSTHLHVGFPMDSAPDRFSTEAWFGIMSIAPNPRNPQGPDVMKERKIYFALQQRWQSNSNLALESGPKPPHHKMSELVLRSGEKIDGNIVEQTDKFIKIDVGVGVPLTYYMDEISRVDGQKIRV